jgi:hypothetical protein
MQRERYAQCDTTRGQLSVYMTWLQCTETISNILEIYLSMTERQIPV